MTGPCVNRLGVRAMAYGAFGPGETNGSTASHRAARVGIVVHPPLGPDMPIHGIALPLFWDRGPSGDGRPHAAAVADAGSALRPALANHGRDSGGDPCEPCHRWPDRGFGRSHA